MTPSIRAQGLWKEYRLGGQRWTGETFYELLSRALRPFSPRRENDTRNSRGDRFWALRDVSFEVAPGEVLGVVGRNGAGKSTLLKILTRITDPSRGRVEIVGRVASLLEVGTGFHAELTGRENVYLNGSILGMTRSEIDRKFDEIVAFSGVERFLDTPVKRYSSGMQVRLAFAVAAHLEPEVLLVDEVLAVGDAEFQQRCLDKMNQVGGQGRTVLFVSHNMVAIQALCSRVLWLDSGGVRASGPPGAIVSDYLSEAAALDVERVWDSPDSAPGSEEVRLRAVRVRPVGGPPGEPIDLDTPIQLEFEFWNLVPDGQISVSITVFSDQGVPVFCSTPMHEPAWYGKPMPRGLFRSCCEVPAHFLNHGTYRVALFLVRNQAQDVFRDDSVLVFKVADTPDPERKWFGEWPGVVRPELHWATVKLSDR